MVLATILTLSISYYLVSIVNESKTHSQSNQNFDCQAKRELLTNQAVLWNTKWSTAATNPGGQIRAEGRQISSEIATLLNQCADALDESININLRDKDLDKKYNTADEIEILSNISQIIKTVAV